MNENRSLVTWQRQRRTHLFPLRLLSACRLNQMPYLELIKQTDFIYLLFSSISILFDGARAGRRSSHHNANRLCGKSIAFRFYKRYARTFAEGAKNGIVIK